MRYPLYLLTAVSVLWTTLVPASAQIIPVTNSSFEDPVLATDPDAAAYPGGYYLATGAIPGWNFTNNSGGGIGIQTIAGIFTLPGTATGLNAVWMNFYPGTGLDPSASNTATSTTNLGVLAPNTDYILTVALGNEANSNNASGSEAGIETIELLAGSTVFSSTFNETQLPVGTFTDKSVTLTAATIAADGLVGQSLGIQLAGTQYGSDTFDQPSFDNVRLFDLPAVPEPKVWAMLALACLGCAFLLSRKLRV